jgi:hypothetical protein
MFSNPTFTGTVSGITNTMVGLGDVTNDSQVKRSEMGANNGVATLSSSGIILTTQLPSYVDDVIEAANLAAFPVIGETGKIYVALDTNKTYRWSGTVYIYITSGAVDSVSGKTGIVTLGKGDVGLGNADNTADSAKNVLSATKLFTARTIAGVSFDGSANVAIPFSGLESIPTTLVGYGITDGASISSLSAHTSNVSNPHVVTSTQLGLGNVTNESKLTMFTSPTFTGNVVASNVSITGTLQVTSNAVVTNLNADFLGGQTGSFYTTNSIFVSHTSNVSNPHVVTSTQLGLGNVTNESKATMFTNPTFTGNTIASNVSITGTLQVTSNTLISNLNADFLGGQTGSFYTTNSIFVSHTSNVSNPHVVTSTQLGLGNVTNESKATMFTSPTFTGNTIASNVSVTGTLKVTSNTVVTNLNADFLGGQGGSYYYQASNPSGYTTNAGTVTSVSGTAPISVATGNTTPAISMAAATASVAGYMTSTYATKLDGIAVGANAYSHPTGDGNLHVIATSTTNSGKVLTAGATAGALSWTTPTTGTVTSVGGTGTVSGLTLTGTVTESGNLTLGGAIGTLNQNTTGSSGSCTGNADNITHPVGTYKHVGAWGVGRVDAGAILVNTAFYADSAGSAPANGGTSAACTGNAASATTAGNLSGTPNITVGTINATSGTFSGSISATTKSFLIDHPTKEGKKLRYGSLESPYHGVRLTGEGIVVNGECRIELPDYIHALVLEKGSQVQLTNKGHDKVLWIDSINIHENYFIVKCNSNFIDIMTKKELGFYWSFTATRKDIDELEVEVG